MLLHRSAPLATVDHFNGELLALTSLSAKREGSQKKGAAADLSSNKKIRERFESPPENSNIYVNNIRGRPSYLGLLFFFPGKYLRITVLTLQQK